jgi:hypothetical protein
MDFAGGATVHVLCCRAAIHDIHEREELNKCDKPCEPLDALKPRGPLDSLKPREPRDALKPEKLAINYIGTTLQRPTPRAAF